MTDAINIDVRANDLTLIGSDDQGCNHYYDVQNRRIIVTTARHREYTPDNSVIIHKQLKAESGQIEHIEPDIQPDDIERYILFIEDAVGGRYWESDTVDVIDMRDLLDVVRGRR